LLLNHLTSRLLVNEIYRSGCAAAMKKFAFLPRPKHILLDAKNGPRIPRILHLHSGQMSVRDVESM
jgi:hypothetical protein